MYTPWEDVLKQRRRWMNSTKISAQLSLMCDACEPAA
jgi:hypothetical protein